MAYVVVPFVHSTSPPPSLTSRTWWWGRGRAWHEGDDHVGHGELRTHDTTQWLTCRTWWWGRGRAARRGRPLLGHGELRTHVSSDLLVERDGGGEVEHHEGDDHVGHGELRTHDTTQWLTMVGARSSSTKGTTTWSSPSCCSTYAPTITFYK